MPKNPDQYHSVIAYGVITVVLEGFRRHGVEAVMDDLQRNCRSYPQTIDEETYKDLLQALNRISEMAEDKKNKSIVESNPEAQLKVLSK